jgi:hypothetical protein
MDKRLARLRAGAFGVLGAAGFLLLFGPLPAEAWGGGPETRLDTDLTPGVMIAFSDSRNGHRLRLTDGTLIEEDQQVVSSRRIRFPQRISVPESY